MKIVCIICTDQITENFAAAPCGHTFHDTCLSQWLCHQKSCPQCRERCLPRNVLKLYIDTSDTASQSNIELDPDEMKEKISLQERQMKLKDEALSEAQKSLNEIRNEVLAWQSQYSDIRKELKEVQGTSDTLRKELKQKQAECDHAKGVVKEAEKIKRKMNTMEGVQRVLSHSKEEVESLIKTYTSPSQLATFVVAMKRDYEALKEKKMALQREKDKLCQECGHLRKQCRSKDQELKASQERLSELERDLTAAEQEKDNMHKRVELLQKALDSPGSRITLRRILESPMPDCVQALRQHPSDLGASPLLASTQKTSNGVGGDRAQCESEKENRETEEVKRCTKEPAQLAGVKRSLNGGMDSEVLMPINKFSKNGQGSRTFASGYNGMGGQSHFAIPSSKFIKPPAAVGAAGRQKALKFAPRLNSQTNKFNNKSRFTQPPLRLK